MPVLSRDVFHDPTQRMARAALELGLAHHRFGYCAVNVTPYGAVIAAPRPETRAPKVERVTPRPTFEEDAVHKFLKWDRQIFVYRDPSDESLRILYRRRDGTLRILVPAL